MSILKSWFSAPPEEKELPMENVPDSHSPEHIHEWGLWEITKEGSITRREECDCGYICHGQHEDRIIGNYIDQRRRCTTCGKYELDTQVSYAIVED